MSWAAPRDPVDLQVDVHVKPVGTARGSRAPLPCKRLSCAGIWVLGPLLSRLTCVHAPALDRVLGQHVRPGLAASRCPGRAQPPRPTLWRRAWSPRALPTCCCRCKEQKLEENKVLLHQVIKLIVKPEETDTSVRAACHYQTR